MQNNDDLWRRIRASRSRFLHRSTTSAEVLLKQDMRRAWMLSPNSATRSSAPCPGSPSSSRIRMLSRDPARSQLRTSDGKSSQYEIANCLSRSSDGIFGGVAYVLQPIPIFWIPGHNETSWYSKEDRKGVLTMFNSLIMGPFFSTIMVRI